MTVTYYTQERPVLALRYTGTNFDELETFFAGTTTDDGPPVLHLVSDGSIIVTYGIERDVLRPGEWAVVLNHSTAASAVVFLTEEQFGLACAPAPRARPNRVTTAALVIERNDDPNSPADQVAVNNQLWRSVLTRAGNIAAAPELERLHLTLTQHERLI